MAGLNAAQREMVDYLLSEESAEVRGFYTRWAIKSQQTNPASWSLNLGDDGRLRMNIGGMGLAYFSLHWRNWLTWASDSPDFTSVLAEKSEEYGIARGKDGNYTTDGLPPKMWIDLTGRFLDEIDANVERFANQVITNGKYWILHRPDVVNLFRALGHDMPEPVYVSSGWNHPDWANVPSPTGHWRASYAVEQSDAERKLFEQSIENGILILNIPHVNQNLKEVVHSTSDPLAALRAHPSVGPLNARPALWFANDMNVGDRVAASLGTEKLAFGRITSDYEYLDGQHLRRVAWQDPIDRPSFSATASQVNKVKTSWGLTPIVEDYFRDLEVNAIPAPPPSGPSVTHIPTTGENEAHSHIQSCFAHQGLSYSNIQIADFYTALQTKGFVVLSGISGTGKSKIATNFAKMFPDGVTYGDVVTDAASGEDGVAVTLYPYSHRYNRIAIPNEFADLFPIPPDVAKLSIRVEIENEVFATTLKQDSILAIYWRKDMKAVMAQHAVGELMVLTPVIGTNEDGEEFVERVRIAFPSGNESALESTPTPNNLQLAVRPDWRDSTALLGYYNPLTQTYEWTDFLRFILDAERNYRSGNPIAWFVILDEMNLAHVEYYFADLLSVLESGRIADPDHSDNGFTEAALRLTYPDTVRNEAPPTEIRLPPNLYIIGTVNMDETTHAFSPKVLDRAFTMELTEVDFTDYPATFDVHISAPADAQKQQLLIGFTQHGRFPRIDKTDISAHVATHPEVREALQRLNKQLGRHRFHFGYRVFDEIVQFLANAERNGMSHDPMEALDSAVFMKILPKFSGSEARIGLALRELIAWANDPYRSGDAAPHLPRTLARAEYMKKVLETDGFVTAF